MCESLELLVCLFHLVILSIEKHGLLDLLYVALIKDILPNAQVLDAEVSLQCVTNSVSACLVNLAVENLKEDEGHMAFNQLCDGLGTDFSQFRVAEF